MCDISPREDNFSPFIKKRTKKKHQKEDHLQNYLTKLTHSTHEFVRCILYSAQGFTLGFKIFIKSEWSACLCITVCLQNTMHHLYGHSIPVYKDLRSTHFRSRLHILTMYMPLPQYIHLNLDNPKQNKCNMCASSMVYKVKVMNQKKIGNYFSK